MTDPMVSNVYFGLSPLWVATALLLLTYAVIISEQINRSVVTLVGAAIMVVLGGLVTLTAPQFLTISNISQVAVLASVIAVAAVGEALVVITRNVDLSVEATIGSRPTPWHGRSSSMRSTRPGQSSWVSASASSSA